ncbi:MAG: alpha-mannosidase, partial [Actinobacteria bacterium]|nr:alpha-mannosidase [Actinomycetota bacterium]
MYQQNQLAELRVDRLVRERLTPALERASVPVAVEMWEVPDEPVPFARAVQGPFEPFSVGRPWGRPWGTVWFRVTGTVPAEWEADPAEVELVVDLGFTAGQVGFQAEGLVWAADGTIVKALEPLNNYVRLQAAPGESFELFVEAASNPDVGSDWSFRPTPVGRKSTAPTASIYTLRRIDVVHRDSEVWELIQDIFTVRGLAASLPDTSPRRAALFAALDDAVVAVDPFA